MKPITAVSATLIICLSLFSAATSAQGLRFVGHNNRIDERTSLEIHNLKRRTAVDSLVLEFEMRADRQTMNGYIFKLSTSKDEDNPSILLHYLVGAGGEYYFRLIQQGRRFLLEDVLPAEDVELSWLRFRLKLMPSTDSLSFQVGSHQTMSADIDLPCKLRASLCFGMTDKILETPSIEVRDLSIGIDGKMVHFPLDEDSGNTARSNVVGIHGALTNPVWLIERNSHWTFEGRCESSEFLCAGYDSLTHQAYAISRDSIITKNLLTKEKSRLATAGRCPVKISIGNSFVNPLDGSVSVYEVFAPDSTDSPCTVAQLDLESLEWTGFGFDQIGKQLHHHSQWFDARNKVFRVFGGFGDSSYSDRFYELDPEAGKWSERDIASESRIWPRFFQSMGYCAQTGKLYIFGGIGNESGEQVIGHNYFYDLHEVDTASWTSKPVWDLDWDGCDMVSSRNMVVDGDARCFYTIMYEESKTRSKAQLFKFSLEDGTHEVLGNSFPVFSDKIGCNVNIHYDRTLDKLLAIVEETEDDISSSVTIYSMSYPPMPRRISTVAKTRMRTALSLVLVGVLLAMVTCLVACRRKKLSSRLGTGAKPAPKEPKANAIHLFGTFKAFDSSGEDISKRFTGKLRTLLYLLIDAEDKGLSAAEISILLWPDKEDGESNNIRSVTTYKLRKALAGMEGVGVDLVDGRYKLSTTSPFYCDLLQLRKDLGGNDLDLRLPLVCISKGKFLPIDSDPALDKLKQQTETMILPVLEKRMEERLKAKDWKAAFECAEMVFWVDPLNGDALRCLVKALNGTGQQMEAHKRYQEFSEKYRSYYSESYPIKFKEL